MTPSQEKSVPLKILYQQAFGKARRWFKTYIYTRQTVQTLSARTGECNRCGACCKIIFQCPFYLEEEGKGSCRIYGQHFSQCKLFPLEPKDLIGIDDQCGYKFDLDKLKNLANKGMFRFTKQRLALLEKQKSLLKSEDYH